MAEMSVLAGRKILQGVVTSCLLRFGRRVLIQGVQKLTLPFKSSLVLNVNLPLQHQKRNLLEETCRFSFFLSFFLFLFILLLFIFIIFFDTKHVSIAGGFESSRELIHYTIHCCNYSPSLIDPIQVCIN